jgi:hypothetical protein
MATLYVTVFNSAGSVAHGDPLQFLSVTVGGASDQTDALTAAPSGSALRICRLYTDTDCFVNWGTNPTATDATDSIPLGADNPEYFHIFSGYKIATIQRA